MASEPQFRPIEQCSEANPLAICDHTRQWGIPASMLSFKKASEVRCTNFLSFWESQVFYSRAVHC